MAATTIRYEGRAGLDAFRTMVDSSLVGQELACGGGHFAAQVRADDLGRVRLLQADVPALRARRGPADIADASGMVFLLLGGRTGTALHHRGGSARVDARHLTVIPDTATFEVAYPARLRLTFAVLDATTVQTRFPWLVGPVRGQPLTPAVAAAYRSAVAAAAHVGGAAAPVAGPRRDDLDDLLLATLCLAVRPLDRSADPGRGLADLHTRATVLIAANLEHPDLSPAWLAAQAHSSLRQVHRAFAAAGTTPAATIREHRLVRAAELLARPGARVVDVAHRLGFASASHLSRRFTERYGVSPSTWAAEAADPTPNGTQVHGTGR